MARRRALALAIATFAPACLATSTPVEIPELESVDYQRDVRPIFADACYTCHGPDAQARQADLRLDQEGDLFGQRRGRPMVLRGQPDESPLYQRLIAPRETRMPPGSGRNLSPREVAIVRRWIELGAPFVEHWAFRPPVRPPLPPLGDSAWSEPIDRFVWSRLAAAGRSPSAPAAPEVQLRRVYLDLTGLPPEPEVVDAFLADPSDAAYAQVVDRLLGSPRAAEHQAREWLDAARYADTHGFQLDLPRVMWAYRDWVIDAYRRQLPYDRFLTEQLAGDLLPGAGPNERLATAFNRNHNMTIEGGVLDAEYRAIYVADRVDTLGVAILGLSLNCARCHDHKYDPVRSRDYYGLYACFNQTEELGYASSNNFAPRASLTSPLSAERRRGLTARLATLTAGLTPSGQAEWEAGLSGAEGHVLLTPKNVQAENDTLLTLTAEHQVTVERTELRDAFTFTATVPAGTSGLHLEVSPRATDPSGAPGQGPSGDLEISELELAVLGPDGDRALPLRTAYADRSLPSGPAPLAIDGDSATGWRVAGPGAATLSVGWRGPLVNGDTIRLRMVMGAGEARLPFRVRIGAGRGVLSAAPPTLRRALLRPAAERSPAEAEACTRYFLAESAPEVRAEQARERDLIEAQLTQSDAVDTMIMADLPTPVTTYELLRGRYDQLGSRVECQFPTQLAPAVPGAPANRLGLAEWLTQPHHPLVPRALANRLWARFFGAGLVETLEDLGTRSPAPTHEGLLDWLAVELVEGGYQESHLIRAIVTSRTYRQSSARRSGDDLDPNNQLLGRGPTHRLAAEVIRDQALFAAGLLVERLGGPSVNVPQPPRLWEEQNEREGLSVPYLIAGEADRHRRSLYTFWKRSLPPPLLATLDAPSREYAVVRRTPTSTPVQAIALLGEPTLVEAARFLAERSWVEANGDVDVAIEWAFRRLLVRRPSPREATTLRAAYDEQHALFAADPAGARRLLLVGSTPSRRPLPIVEHAAMTMVTRILLNLGETITKE